MANSDKGRRDLDRDAIERDYRAGTLSLRELADKHGCARSTIANLARRKGWSRDQPHGPGADSLLAPFALSTLAGAGGKATARNPGASRSASLRWSLTCASLANQPPKSG